MADRLCPVDEAQRLVRLMTAEERTRFLAWLLSAPDRQRRPALPRHQPDMDPSLVRLDEGDP